MFFDSYQEAHFAETPPEIDQPRDPDDPPIASLGRPFAGPAGSAHEAAARAPRGTLQPARRKLNLSPQRKASLKLQGQYIGHTRMLPARQQARVKALRLKKGVRAAIRYAQTLSKRRK